MHRLLAGSIAVLILAAGICAAQDAAGGATRVETTASWGLLGLHEAMEPPASPAAEVGRERPWDTPVPRPVAIVLRVLAGTRGALAGGYLTVQRLLAGEPCGAGLRPVRVEAEEIIAAARRHLESLIPEGAPHVNIELLTDVAPVRVPDGSEPVTLHASLSESRPQAGNVQVDVDLMRGTVLLKRVSVSFFIMRCGTVVLDRRSQGEMRAC